MPPGSASWPRPACCGRASCRPSRSAPCATSPAIARRRSRSAREANRLHKALEDTGIKLDCVATDILGVSGRAILAHIDFLDEQIERLSEAIGEQIRPFAPAVSLLCSIPGIQHRAAEVIIAEIGTDMTIFPSPKHLASFAGQCPGNDQSAGKRRSGRTRKGSKWLDWTLEEAALAAIRSKDAYLAAQYHRLRPRRGHKKRSAPSSTRSSAPAGRCSQPASSTATLGGDYFQRRDPARTTKRLIAQLEALGHHVTLEPMAA